MADFKRNGVAVRETEQKTVKQKSKNKKGRVIIRNLSFKVTETVLRNNFSKFGEISEIAIPKKPDGKLYGFAFVQFEKTASAIRAINALNAKEILGRPVAIDFAIPKDKFKGLKTQTADTKQGETENFNEKSTEEKDYTSDDNESDNDKKKKQSLSSGDSDTGNSDTSEDESSDEKPPNKKRKKKQSKTNDNDTEDSDREEILLNKKRKYSRSESESDVSSDDDDDSSDATDDEHYVEKNRKTKQSKLNNDKGLPSAEKKKFSRPSDVGEGKTLFIRNLSFDTTAEELKDTMSKFGGIKYCLLCKDPLTEYSKGTAFVQFLSKEDAEKCLHDSNSKDTKIILGGRPLNIVLALTREDIEKQKEAKVKKGKDNRNLKLQTEGLIRPGSEAAEGVSQPDLAKRVQLESYKRKLLKNLNYFISPVRLCVHNMPLHLTDQKLRKIFLKAAGPGGLITEARIMRNLKKLDEKGVGVSKGFGFVSFTKHEHALEALRKLNNNPDTFSPHKRPIVEFSLENRSILNAKRRHMERQNKKPFAQNKIRNYDQNKKNVRTEKGKFQGDMKKKQKQFKGMAKKKKKFKANMS